MIGRRFKWFDDDDDKAKRYGHNSKAPREWKPSIDPHRRACPWCKAPDAELLFHPARCHFPECKNYSAALEFSTSRAEDEYAEWVRERRSAEES